jgi:formate-dependent nitrite reductase membrane component NrfD
MEAHEWMIKKTRQKEWIDKRGLFLWLALYTGGLGGGLYLVSLYLNSLAGMIVAWIIVAVLKGGFHFAFLGRPWRFWRIVTNPGTSWLSRGFIFVVAFVGFAALQIISSILLPNSIWEIVLKVLAGAAAFGVATYTGFVLNTVKSIPFWNSSLLPVLFVMCGILGGFGLSVVIALYGGSINLDIAETGSRWLLVMNVLLISVYLWRAVQKGGTGRQSVLEQLSGNVAPVFWVGVVALGIVIPLAIAFASVVLHHIATGLLLTGVACELIGGLSLRYCILKAGIYNPLLTVPHYEL